jgi:hypothetical protein
VIFFGKDLKVTSLPGDGFREGEARLLYVTVPVGQLRHLK